jgi:hypothetical protein
MLLDANQFFYNVYLVIYNAIHTALVSIVVVLRPKLGPKKRSKYFSIEITCQVQVWEVNCQSLVNNATRVFQLIYHINCHRICQREGDQTSLFDH